MLETIVEAGDRDPWRVALFGTTYAAGQAKKVLAKEYAHNWEWTSTRDSEGRPALFVRWLGPQQAGQL